MNRLRRLIYFAYGVPFSDSAFSAQGVGVDNFVTWLSFHATGSGTSILIDWIGAGIADLSHHSPACSLMPGSIAIDSWGVKSEIINIDYTSATSARLTLDIALDCSISPFISIPFQNKPFQFPVFHLDDGPGAVMSPYQCKYSIKTFHRAYSSWKALNPTAPKSWFIYGEYFCSQMDSYGIGPFNSDGTHHCNATNCILYTMHVPGIETANALSQPIMGRGPYVEQMEEAIGNTAPAGYHCKLDDDDFPGLMKMIGMRIGSYGR